MSLHLALKFGDELLLEGELGADVGDLQIGVDELLLKHLDLAVQIFDLLVLQADDLLFLQLYLLVLVLEVV